MRIHTTSTTFGQWIKNVGLGLVISKLPDSLTKSLIPAAGYSEFNRSKQSVSEIVPFLRSIALWVLNARQSGYSEGQIGVQGVSAP